MKILIPVVTVSEANSHTHWRKRSKRAQAHRTMTRVLLTRRLPKFPVRVTLTRLSPRSLDSDNLQGALKHVRDGVADAVGVDDRDPRYEWVYQQTKATEYGVLVEIESLITG